MNHEKQINEMSIKTWNEWSREQHTCEYSWHESAKHEEQHAEEETAGVVVRLA